MPTVNYMHWIKSEVKKIKSGKPTCYSAACRSQTRDQKRITVWQMTGMS